MPRLLSPNSAAFKTVILTILTLSTSLTVLLLRISRLPEMSDAPGSPPYLPSTVVFLTEIVKFALCLGFHFCFQGFEGGYQSFKEDVVLNPRETFRLIIPAGLYALQNNLLYAALTYLDSASYQVTYQLKILTTAIFSVLLLRRRLKFQQWVALMLLSFGVMMVQFQNSRQNPDVSLLKKAESSHLRLLGILYVLGACVTSGASGVYFELLVKTSAQKSVIVRNLQLGLISIPMTFVAVIVEDFSKVSFFQGYNNLTFSIIMLQSLGGLLVAIVVKYADNILKGFSTSISIILCSICSHLFIEENSQSPGSLFYGGTVCVVSASILYSYAAGGESVKKPSSVLVEVA